MYYTRIEYQPFQATKVQTLAAAKRAASRSNLFEGVRLEIAVKNGGDFQVVSTKRGKFWVDMFWVDM